ncbi:MAG: HAMP domain-containing histidine kinase [Acetatifactor sp.]|nr:HAMP domain-containing histidine kinase [Acetatifactor sp.]
MKRFIKRAWHWFLLLLTTDMVFIFVTWLIRPQAVMYMSLFFSLFTVLVLGIGFWAEFVRQRKDEAALMRFLEMPDEQTKENLLRRFDDDEAVCTLCTQIFSNLSLLNEKTVELNEYREYIEAWVHEAKTPLSLSTLVLNNHRDEMSPYVYARLDYIQHQLNEDVERILYYARLQAEHPDVRFTQFRLDECVMEVLDEYRGLTEEKHILLTMELKPLTIASDRKIVLFMVSQIVGNAVKYADGNKGKISVVMCGDQDKVHLSIYNNGEGVPPEDAAFVFDKGFTGSHPNRQKATGMGLYLVHKYAEKLCVQVGLDDKLPYDTGFGIELTFAL